MSASSAAESSTIQRAFRSPGAWVRLLFILAIGLGLDLGSKYWSFENVAGKPVVLDRKLLLADPDYNPIPFHRGMHVLPGRLLDFQLVINRGAVFGMGQDQRFFFIAFTLAALSAGLFVFGRFTMRRDCLAHVSIALILAGGIGNLYDRIIYAAVRDFLHMLPGYRLPFNWNWPGGSPELFPWVFNVADVMLLMGMGMLMLHMSRLERRRKKSEEAAKLTAIQSGAVSGSVISANAAPAVNRSAASSRGGSTSS